MRFIRSSIFVIGVFLLMSQPAFAGFGVTPPYVSNVSLTRNSVYEQTIYLVRSDPTTDLKATVSIDVPGVNDWFVINEGSEFVLPKGQQKVPMTVKVTVPDKAEYKQYVGNIRIKTGATDNTAQNEGVSISLGAQIDVDLTVIDKKIKDFKVRKIGISDLNEGHKLAWLYFPGKIKFSMFIENLGNVLLEETHKNGKITEVKPFMTDTVVAELPTKLPSGSYLARFEIKNGDDTKLSGEVNLSVLPYGTLQEAGFGFLGLSLAHKLSIIIPVVFIFLSFFGFFVHLRRRK